MRYAAVAILLAGLIPGSALAAPVVGTGGASVPSEPETGGARAVQNTPAPAPAAEPDSEPRATAPEREEPAAEPEPSQSPARPATAAADTDEEPERPAAETAQDDGPDVEVPVPPMDEPSEPEPPAAAPVPAPADDAAGLAQTGLDAAPLLALGFALMVAGLTALRLLTRRTG